MFFIILDKLVKISFLIIKEKIIWKLPGSHNLTDFCCEFEFCLMAYQPLWVI